MINRRLFWILAALLAILLIPTMVWAAPPAAMSLYNDARDQYVIEDASTVPRSIASITKVMTAMVILDARQDMDENLRLSRAVASSLPRQYFTRRDLMRAMLIKSDNAAAETLAENYPGGRHEFLVAMHEKARRLKMRNTAFVDASGLGRGNISTARDLTRMMLAAKDYEFIREASTRKQMLLDTYHKSRVRTIELWNTNRPLLFEFDNVIASKTGFTSAAGWCIAMAVENGPDVYVIVVLGSRDKISRAKTVKTVLYNHIQDRDIQDDPGWQIP